MFPGSLLKDALGSLKKRERVHDATPSAWGLFPLVGHVDENILVTQDETYVFVFRIPGVSGYTASAQEINAWYRERHQMFRGLGQYPLCFSSYLVREDACGYPEGECRSAFARGLDAQYQARMKEKRLLKNTWYLAVEVKKELGSIQKGLRIFEEIRPSDRQAASAEHLAQARMVCSLVSEFFRGKYDASLLGVYSEGAGEETTHFSEVLEFFSFLLNGVWQRVPLLPVDYRDALLTSTLRVEWETVHQIATGTAVLSGLLSVLQYRTPCRPTDLRYLFSLPFPFVLCQTFETLEPEPSRAALERQEGFLQSVGDRSEDRGDEGNDGKTIGDGTGTDDGYQTLSYALTELDRGTIFMGKADFLLFVKAATERTLQQRLSEAQRALTRVGFVVGRENMGLESGFWKLFPGSPENRRPRPQPISHRNFCALSSFHGDTPGHPGGDHWGPPVVMCETASHGPHWLSLFLNGVGNTFVSGKTGSGKTVFMTFLSAMLEKQQASGIYFDYDRGAEIFIRSCGGVYYPVRIGERTGFNPFCLPSTPQNLAFTQMFFTRLLTVHEGELLTTEERSLVADAVRNVFLLEQPLRRAISLLSFLPDSLRKRLEPWVGNGSKAWFVDNPVDTISFEGNLTGVDMTEFLGDEEIRSLTMIYLFYRMRLSMLGKRFFVVVDEFWKALDDPFFESLLKTEFKTVRKKDWFLLTGTQSVADAAESRIFSTIRGQSSSFVFFPDPQGVKEHYVEYFGCTQREAEIVTDELIEGSGQFLFKQGNTSAVLSIDLKGFPELAVLSGTSARVQLLEQIRADPKIGDDPARFLSVFYEQVQQERRS